MISAFRILIVSVFISATLIYSRGICFQTPYFTIDNNGRQSTELSSLHSVEFAILENSVKSTFGQLNQKAEKSINVINLWRNVQKIAFSGKNLESSIKSVRSIFYKIKIFSNPDISFPFDYFL